MSTLYNIWYKYNTYLCGSIVKVGNVLLPDMLIGRTSDSIKALEICVGDEYQY